MDAVSTFPKTELQRGGEPPPPPSACSTDRHFVFIDIFQFYFSTEVKLKRMLMFSEQIERGMQGVNLGVRVEETRVASDYVVQR
jgi:hypothetical protein